MNMIVKKRNFQRIYAKRDISGKYLDGKTQISLIIERRLQQLFFVGALLTQMIKYMIKLQTKLN